MGMKRVSIANIRTMSIAGNVIEVPRYIHRHMEPSGWSVSVAGIRKYFRDDMYGGMVRALTQAKIFLAQLIRHDEASLLQHAQIAIKVFAPKDHICTVHAFFKDAATGKDMRLYVGDVKTDLEFWPSVQYAFQVIPAWLTGLDFTIVKNEWLSMHRRSMNHIYHRDDFKKFLDEILSFEQQTALEF